MKKHDEGYALVLVLVVIVVLGMIAGTLMTFSLRNLQSQRASVDRMVAKYVAEGEIEKVTAKLNDLIENPRPTPVTFEELFGTEFTPSETGQAGQLEVNFTASGQENEMVAKISCSLLLTAEKVEKTLNDYTITKLQSVEYSSYDISYEEITEGGGS